MQLLFYSLSKFAKKKNKNKGFGLRATDWNLNYSL